MKSFLMKMLRKQIMSFMSEALQEWIDDPDTTNEKRKVDGAVLFLDYLIERKL